MPRKNHGPSIKNDEKYEKLRDQGYSKEKSARIANTPSKKQDRSKMGRSYDTWTKQELYDKAKKVGIEGRSNMNKQELIRALRNH